MSQTLLYEGEWVEIELHPVGRKIPERIRGKVVGDSEWGVRLHVHSQVVWEADASLPPWRVQLICDQTEQRVVSWNMIKRLSLASACSCWLASV